VFVSAGAGTGKTAVLVERFVRAVCDRGLDVDSILVITYTRRAAGELRRAFALRSASAAGRTSRASSTAPGSRRSTASACGCSRRIHSRPASTRASASSTTRRGPFCGARRFRSALDDFYSRRRTPTACAARDYGADGLRRMLTGVYETLRSAGRDLSLDIGSRMSWPAASTSCARRRAASQNEAASTDKPADIGDAAARAPRSRPRVPTA